MKLLVVFQEMEVGMLVVFNIVVFVGVEGAFEYPEESPQKERATSQIDGCNGEPYQPQEVFGFVGNQTNGKHGKGCQAC
jgi:hypothetical protein